MIKLMAFLLMFSYVFAEDDASEENSLPTTVISWQSDVELASGTSQLQVDLLDDTTSEDVKNLFSKLKNQLGNSLEDLAINNLNTDHLACITFTSEFNTLTQVRLAVPLGNTDIADFVSRNITFEDQAQRIVDQAYFHSWEKKEFTNFISPSKHKGKHILSIDIQKTIE